jgi:hypothetical protein
VCGVFVCDECVCGVCLGGDVCVCGVEYVMLACERKDKR